MNEANETEKIKDSAEAEKNIDQPQEVSAQEPQASKKSDQNEKQEKVEILKIKKVDHDQLEKERNDFRDKFYYLAAEKENLEKRYEREKENLIKYGNEKILSELLSVVDNLDLTMSAIVNDEDEKIKNIFVGIEMVKHQFAEILKNNGLELIESVDQKFDPNFHEALMQRKEEGKKPNIILEEVQKGYILNGRVVRAAKVIISK